MKIVYRILEDELEHVMALLSTADSPLERNLPSAEVILTKGVHSFLTHLHNVVYFQDGSSVSYWVSPLLAPEFRVLIHLGKGSTPGDPSSPDNQKASEWLLREYPISHKYQAARTWLTWAPAVLTHLKELEASCAG